MTAAAAIPHERIRDLRDRSWTATLIEALYGGDDDERVEIAETLGVLADPRAVPGLTAIVVASAATPALREVAGALLRHHHDAPPVHVVHSWWQQGDRVLRRHALRSMPDESSEVLAVASDPRHPLHADAIAELMFGYEEPAHQQLKVAALGHLDPRVRLAAADALLWDEPRAAEAALVSALDDRAVEVALAARATLVYYDSRHVLRALSTVAPPTGAEHFAATARSSFTDVVRSRSRAVQRQLAPWLRPILDLLDDDEDRDDDDDATDDDGAGSDRPEAPGADEILALLEVVDGPWALPRAQLGLVDPMTVAADARAAIAERAAGHPDSDVRALTADWLAAWRDEPRLRELLDDDAFLVRKAAAYAYAALPPDPALAAGLLAHLERRGVASTHARETLRSFAVHARPDELLPILRDLALADRRESVRDTAIGLLVERSARDVLAPMMIGLAAPPRVTWAVHVGLLEAARRLALPAPDAAALVDVDSLQVQLALAELATAV